MEKYCLLIEWNYRYDKEGTWTDHYTGSNRYDLVENNSFTLPEMMRKHFEILSVSSDDGEIRAELNIDGKQLTVSSSEAPVSAYVSHDYSVCGDCVSTSLSMNISIVKQ